MDHKEHKKASKTCVVDPQWLFWTLKIDFYWSKSYKNIRKCITLKKLIFKTKGTYQKYNLGLGENFFCIKKAFAGQQHRSN